MSILRADYFDGKTSRKHPVTVLISGDRLNVVGHDVSESFDARRVRRSLRIANTPRWLYLPGGGACVASDNDTVDRITHDRRYEVLLHKWESRPAYAALAVALVVAVMWLLIDRGLPAAAELVAAHIPHEAETELGRQTLEKLEQYILKPTRIPDRRQVALREKLFELVDASGDETPYRVEFRASPIFGANAFALPSGIIVMTDELVKVAKDDLELVGVLAHELGHVRHRHTMRRLLQGSATALVIAGVTGDIASTASLAAAAPTLLMQTKYSRDNEREADAYAIALMRKSGIPPHHLAAILRRLERETPKRSGVPSFLSSHPLTDERESIALAGASGGSDAREVANASATVVEPDKRKRAVKDPAQRQVIALVEQRNFEELERFLAGYQERFELDPETNRDLDSVFRAFRALPASAEAALNEWIEKMPASYSARLGRGIFFVWQGLEVRGTAFMRDTPEEYVLAMRALLAKAQTDLERSLKLTQKPYLSRLTLMTLIQNVGSRASVKEQYIEAVKLAPQSLEVRFIYMTSLEPRWGGSFAEMEAFSAESAAQLKSPAAAARLKALIPAERADELSRAKQYAESLRHFDEAIALDPDSSTLCRRSWVKSELNRHAEAFADVKLALSKSRNDDYCLGRAVWAAQRVDDWKEIVNLMSLVLDANPEMAGAYTQRAWAYFELRKVNLSFEDYLAGAKLGDGNAQLSVGKMYFLGTGTPKDLEQAIFWFRKAAAQGKPDSKTLLAQARRQLDRRNKSK